MSASLVRPSERGVIRCDSCRCTFGPGVSYMVCPTCEWVLCFSCWASGAETCTPDAELVEHDAFPPAELEVGRCPEGRAKRAAGASRDEAVMS